MFYNNYTNEKPSKKDLKKMTADEKEIFDNRYKIQAETLQFKLNAEIEKSQILQDEIYTLKHTDYAKENIRLKQNIDSLKSEISSLKSEISKLKLSAQNDSEKIELETKIKIVQADNTIIKSENEHLKKLLDAYRAMPDVNNMIKNLSNLAIPELDKIKELSIAFTGEKATEISNKLDEIDKHMHKFIDMNNDLYSHFGVPRYRLDF